MPPFRVVSPFQPSGDQPAAIDALAKGIERGDRFQTLLGITGSGKSATIAWMIEHVQRPTLIIAPNKSLAAQLSNEMRELFPENRVEYFVSYYDYYQPEAYLPSTDTYIEKDSSINDEIDRLRHATTSALLIRRDVIVVASVSCIYGLGSPEEYRQRSCTSSVGDRAGPAGHPATAGRHAVRAQRHEPGPGQVPGPGRHHRGPPGLRGARWSGIELFGDEIERIVPIDLLTGESWATSRSWSSTRPPTTWPATSACRRAILGIETELRERLARFESQGKLLEAQRLRCAPSYDLEMLAEIGSCSGIENYSRHIDGRAAGTASVHPARLLPQGLPAHHRRVPRDRAATPWPVRRRPVAEGDAGRARVPAAFSRGQPAAEVRRVLRAGEPVRVRVGHPWPYEIEHSAQSSSRSSGRPVWSTLRSSSCRPRDRSTT